MKKYLIYSACAVVTLLFYSCDKDSKPGDVTNKTKVLSSNDFNGNLTLEDITDGIDYIIEDIINVNNGLTIRPGVTILFKEGAGIYIRESGYLEARGTQDKKISFTSEIKVKGAWAGILVHSTSLRNIFEHCIFEYAGKDNWGNETHGALSTWTPAALNIDHCIFRNNKFFGVDLYGSENVELRSFNDNVFENNDAPIMTEPHNAVVIGSNNKFADLSNYIHIENLPLLRNNTTFIWKELSIPYLINSALNISNSNLTLQPGVKIEFTENGYINVDNGSLTAEGTPEKNIIFSGQIKAPGSWGGLAYSFTTSSRNKLEYVTIEYAGGSVSEFSNGVIYMWSSPTLSVNNCTFRNNKQCIFNANSGSPFSQPNLTENNNTMMGSPKLCQ